MQTKDNDLYRLLAEDTLVSEAEADEIMNSWPDASVEFEHNSAASCWPSRSHGSDVRGQA